MVYLMRTPVEIDAIVGRRSYAFTSLMRAVWRWHAPAHVPLLPGAHRLVTSGTRRIHAAAYWLGLALMLVGVHKRGALVYGAATLWRVLICTKSYSTAATLHGCLGLISGLSSPAQLRFWLRLQYVLIYGGAATNKLLLENWRTGRTFRYFALDLVKSPEAALAVRCLRRFGVSDPEKAFGLAGGWFSMGMELLLALLYLNPRSADRAARLALWFHYMILVTGGGRIAWVYLHHALTQWAWFALPSPRPELGRGLRPVRGMLRVARSLMRSALILGAHYVAVRAERKFSQGMGHMATYTPQLDAEDLASFDPRDAAATTSNRFKLSPSGTHRKTESGPREESQPPDQSRI